jgi:hypothetical protein
MQFHETTGPFNAVAIMRFEMRQLVEHRALAWSTAED